jgi:hypothetical protein
METLAYFQLIGFYFLLNNGSTVTRLTWLLQLFSGTELGNGLEDRGFESRQVL